MSEWHAVFLELAVFGLNNVHFMRDGVDESANTRRMRRGTACHHTGEMQSRGDHQASFARRSEGWKKGAKSVRDCVPRQGLVVFKNTNEPLVPFIWCYGEVI
jgi:hypothetical protein